LSLNEAELELKMISGGMLIANPVPWDRSVPSFH
jgi:hypothetical protein